MATASAWGSSGALRAAGMGTQGGCRQLCWGLAAVEMHCGAVGPHGGEGLCRAEGPHGGIMQGHRCVGVRRSSWAQRSSMESGC